MDAITLHTSGTREALHATAVRLYELARTQVALAGGRADPDTGEIKPRTWVMSFAEHVEDISAAQRGFLHAVVFPQISEQVRVDGVRYVSAIWKEYYRKMFLGYVWKSVRMPGDKRATPRRIRVSTEDLGPKRYSEHIDKVIAHATTELGVVFVFNDRERESVRYVRPTRRAKVAQQEVVPA